MRPVCIKTFLTLVVLCLFSAAFLGEDRVNAIQDSLSQKLHQLEKTNHVKIGLSIIKIGNNLDFGFHASQRFPMDNTSKFMIMSAVLKKSEHSCAGSENCSECDVCVALEVCLLRYI